MAHFSPNSPFPLLDHTLIDPTLDSTQIIHQSLLFDNTHLVNNFCSLLPDQFFTHQVHQQTENFPAKIFHQNLITPPSVSNSTNNHSVPIPEIIQTETQKRKAFDVSESTSSFNTSPQVSGCAKEKNSSRRRKRAKEEEGKPKDVVHVRARRGEATDSHSLAERVRRGKINERLKCLQDIVPGCYKTMGMAVMLDEIINYVHSLQNQVEFLSMKLTAASTFYDFNSETDAIETILRAKAQDQEKKMERASISTTYHHPSFPL